MTAEPSVPAPASATASAAVSTSASASAPPSGSAQAPATSYVSGTSDLPLLGETIGANFARMAAANADREALVDVPSGRRWTYAELDADVDRLALGLMAAGIAKGDRVGIWALNCPEWVLVQYATAKIGAILVNVNPSYRQHELAYAVKQSGLRLLVSMATYRTTDYRAMIDAVRPECPDLGQVVYIGDSGWDRLIESGQAQRQGQGQAQGQAPESLAERMATLGADDPINIQYTSGTTGYPKGATLSHHNILNNGFFVTETIRFTNEDRLCIPVPFYHCFGMVMGNLGATSHGAAMVIPAPSFDAAATLKAVQDERCTALYGVPTMFIAEQNLPDFSGYDLSTLRTGIMAGSPCPVEVMKRCISEMNMAQVAIAYGMTETSPVSMQTRPDDDVERRTATVGRVHPHLEVKIVDPASGLTVPRGTPGEFCTRGYSVMLGYWNDPTKTAEAIDEARWMHTGDLAEMREDGYVNIVGRIKDMVIRGGENLYPREIEEFLYSHPDIADVQVIGVPDPRYGEELCAWIKLRAGADPLDAAGVAAFCEGKLSRHKVPRYVLVVDEFPMTVTGKVRKMEMRATSVELLGLKA
jgi:fatty-acyl-CoA synthase